MFPPLSSTIQQPKNDASGSGASWSSAYQVDEGGKLMDGWSGLIGVV